MSWNYRVLKTQAKGDVPVWAVHEVYYDDAGTITQWSENPTRPQGESCAELQRDLQRYAAALTKRPLDVTSGSAVELTILGRPKVTGKKR